VKRKESAKGLSVKPAKNESEAAYRLWRKHIRSGYRSSKKHISIASIRDNQRLAKMKISGDENWRAPKGGNETSKIVKKAIGERRGENGGGGWRRRGHGWRRRHLSMKIGDAAYRKWLCHRRRQSNSASLAGGSVWLRSAAGGVWRNRPLPAQCWRLICVISGGSGSKQRQSGAYRRRKSKVPGRRSRLTRKSHQMWRNTLKINIKSGEGAAA